MPARIVAIEHMTLDGVFQAPGDRDEDRRNGFDRGGWAAAHDTPETQGAIGKLMSGGWSLLAGSFTYDGLYRGWRVKRPDEPMARALTGVQKFVVTRNAGLELKWENSTLLSGEAAESVRALKSQQEGTLVIFGSGRLVRTLLAARLVDEMLLMIHPIVLAEGFRLFDGAPPADFTVMAPLVARTGRIVASYRPGGA